MSDNFHHHPDLSLRIRITTDDQGSQQLFYVLVLIYRFMVAGRCLSDPPTLEGVQMFANEEMPLGPIEYQLVPSIF